jgi:hypothetical protein
VIDPSPEGDPHLSFIAYAEVVNAGPGGGRLHIMGQSQPEPVGYRQRSP